MRYKNTKEHSTYWKDRKIDWKKDYLSTYNHPHRLWLVEQLKRIKWSSVFEIGCGPGANLVPIGIVFPQAALGGIDINPEAIALANSTFPQGSVFQVGEGNDCMMSDKSTDLVLTDMTMIYVDPKNIKSYLTEAVRMARRYVVLCEFYHPKWWKRLKMTLQGRCTHNYPKILDELGCSDIMVVKMPERLWPGAHDNEYRYLITARV